MIGKILAWRPLPWVVIALVLLLWWRDRGGIGPDPALSPPQVDTVSVPEWREDVDTMRSHTERLIERASSDANLLNRVLARLEALERRGPTHITVTDSVVLPADVPPPQWVIDRRGTFSLAGAWADSAGQLRGYTGRGIKLGDCDEGARGSGFDAVCDRAALGHLRLVLRGGVSLAAADVPGLVRLEPPKVFPELRGGLRWEQCYRCALAAELLGDPAIGTGREPSIGLSVSWEPQIRFP